MKLGTGGGRVIDIFEMSPRIQEPACGDLRRSRGSSFHQGI